MLHRERTDIPGKKREESITNSRQKWADANWVAAQFGNHVTSQNGCRSRTLMRSRVQFLLTLKLKWIAATIAIALTSTSAEAGYTLSTLVNFNGTNGSHPYADLMVDGAGNLYGNTWDGGTNSQGNVYKIAGGTTASPGAVTTLATFNNTNGLHPRGGLIADASGNLYGTTDGGGANSSGTVFKIAGGTTATPGALSTLATFNGSNGATPFGGLTTDATGNLYGTTFLGGANNSGTVYKIAGGATATPGALSTLATFNTTNGGNPYARLIADAAGNLYGTTVGGGTSNAGTVFKLIGGATATPGAFTTLASLSTSIGSNPYGGLIADATGNLYGTTRFGGANGNGTVFKIAGGATSNPGALTTLASFTGTNGSNPFASLALDAAGNLYGTTEAGGANGVGTVFKIAGGATSTPGPITTLISFNTTNGKSPNSTLVTDAAGNLYGTSYEGGLSNFGTVFKLTLAGGGNWANGSGGVWELGSNWSNGDAPGSANDASLNLANTYTVNFAVPATAKNLNVSAGDVTLTLGSQILQLSGNLSITGGRLAHAGTLRTGTATAGQIGVKGNINLSGGTLSATSLDLGGTASRLNWTAGTLRIGNSAPVADGLLTVPNAGTLQLGGTIDRPVIVSSGGTCEPDGQGVSAITASANFTLSSNATLRIQVGGNGTIHNAANQWDQIIMTGSSNFTVGGANLVVSLSGNVILNQAYRIVKANTGSTVNFSQMFANLTSGTNFNTPSVKYFVTYNSGFIDITFTQVPEPAASPVIALGLGWLLRRRRAVRI